MKNGVKITKPELAKWPNIDTPAGPLSSTLSNWRDYHKEIEKKGYEVLSMNQAAKDGKVFWIVFKETKTEISFHLEEYGKII